MIFDHPKLVAATSQRAHQNMSFVYGDVRHSLENRKKFLNSLNIDYKLLVCARQVHGSLVSYICETDRGRGALSEESAIFNTDALITNIRNLALAVFTADCLTIFLYDPISHSIGLIHAGWRSTKESVTLKTVQLMEEKFKTQSKDLYVGFGPGIRNCCYEVREEFRDHFTFGLIERNSHYYLDLVSINKKQLLDLGVNEKNTSDTKICTSCQNNQFFSYRKEGNNCGRMMSVMMLK